MLAKNRNRLTSAVLVISLGFGSFFVAGKMASAAIEFNLDADYNKEIWELNEDINAKREAIDDLNRQAQAYQKSIESKRREISSLSYEVSTINQTITKISLEKEALELEIERINLEIENTQLKIQATEEQIAIQKERMATLVRTLYQADKENNILEILATSENVSDYFSQLQQLESLQDDLLAGADNLYNLRIALIGDQETLDGNKDEISNLQEELGLKAELLESQKDVKFNLIEQTRGEESTYQALLEELRQEQQQINSDIVRLEEVAREKLNRQIAEGQVVEDGPMIWPVPSRYITAQFHDPDYPYRHVFEHPAIDIRASQGTPIRAAQSGYVGRAKDAGLGYSYILLVHEDGLSTVYGHVSSIAVTEGDFVVQGQVIGNSGGAPGTAGAGRLTTGAHLHFEVRLNGIPVNPENYLP